MEMLAVWPFFGEKLCLAPDLTFGVPICLSAFLLRMGWYLAVACSEGLYGTAIGLVSRAVMDCWREIL